jgi:hypothetical protein
MLSDKAWNRARVVARADKEARREVMAADQERLADTSALTCAGCRAEIDTTGDGEAFRWASGRVSRPWHERCWRKRYPGAAA